jgi:hypothetical protein
MNVRTEITRQQDAKAKEIGAPLNTPVVRHNFSLKFNKLRASLDGAQIRFLNAVFQIRRRGNMLRSADGARLKAGSTILQKPFVAATRL